MGGIPGAVIGAASVSPRLGGRSLVKNTRRFINLGSQLENLYPSLGVGVRPTARMLSGAMTENDDD